jgi:hypothetical protein
LRIVTHPPERGLRLPVAAAATCGGTCCTSTCSSAHTIGGLLGAYAGARRAVAAAQSPENRQAAQSAVTLYGFILFGLSVAALGMAGFFFVAVGFPILQLIASLIAVVVAAVALRPRRAAVDTILMMTGQMFVYALIGGVITYVPIMLFFGEF